MSDQDLLMALSPEGSSTIPVVLPYEGIYIRDHYAGLFDIPWWYAHDINLGHQLAYIGQYMNALDIDWYSPILTHSPQFRHEHRMVVHEGHIEYLDNSHQVTSSVRRPRIGGSGDECRDLYVPYDKIERDPAAITAWGMSRAFRPYDEGADSLVTVQKAMAKGRKAMLGFVESPFEAVFDLWGFEGTMIAVATEKDLVKRACKACLDSALITVETYRRIGCRIIWVEECLSDLISPEDYKSLVLPYLLPVLEAIRSGGMYSTYYFTGSPKGKLDLIFSSGADAYSFEDDKKGFHVDLPEVATMLKGRATLLGNLNAVADLQDADDDQLCRRIRAMTAVARQNGGRFVMSLGSPVTPATPVSRVNRYIAVTRSCNRL
jgi:hypothetical protein